MTKKRDTPDRAQEADPAELPTAAVPPGQASASPVIKPVQPASTPAVERSSSAEVADFLARIKNLPKATTTGRGRLVFAMDATMSRQPTWDMALGLQADMFAAVKAVGGLDVQLVYFRGSSQCRASKWVDDPEALARLMTQVSCQGGYTQIGRVLSHTRQESELRRVSALVYVGDSMEESIDELCGRAGELALLGVPVFLFQEGQDAQAERAFREIARLTRGACCRFDTGAAAELRALLEAVAVYAAGGRLALARLAERANGTGARRLIEGMRRS
ncbi:MAG: VWA domain-containing protein [Hyphomicrobiaceae bacterium]